MSLIQQDILTGPQYPRTLTIHRVSAKDAARQLTARLSDTGTELEDIVPFGIEYHVSSKGETDFMCLVQPNAADVFLIPFSRGSKMGSIASFLCADGSDRYPLASKVCLVGFGMAEIAIQIFQATNLRVNGVDLLTLFNNIELASELIEKKVDSNVKKSAVRRLWMGNNASAKRDVALRAWLAACAGEQCMTEVITAHKLDTLHVPRSELACLSQLVTQRDLLEKIKPRIVQNDFSKAEFNSKGEFQIHNARFKTRVRRSDQTHVVMTDMNDRRFKGTAIESKGKATTIQLKGKVPSGDLRSVKVVGLPEPTNAERARNELIYLVLAGRKNLQESWFIHRLWFPRIGQTTSGALKLHRPDNIISRIELNDSQCTAMRAMVGQLPIVIVHGPPGTGKTTTITAAAQVWDSFKHPVWIVAHSNVAVKNIAEKLLKHKVDFKIIISKEFYEGWHEHLYQSMEPILIRSNQFSVDINRRIEDSRIILSTLSMMLNKKLHTTGAFNIVPPRCLVVDEASQISAFEYMPVFDKFRKDIKKVCFFGDPCQLPPFGQEEVPNMKTIFDFKHLNVEKDTYFLDTQYRMPNPIARFISQNVYEGRLLSSHSIDDSNCLALIDVPRTGEESAGHSTKNSGEVESVIHLVKYYYRKLEFCVITPYDAQRAAIQKGLKDEKLPWETVYNVDSFQGNEADYVIVSLVRSSRAGFLRSVQRMNVLLTRCRRGLIIVSSRAFLGPEGKGADTLLGKLVQHWQDQYTHEWIDWRSVANAAVDLPGIRRSPLNISATSRPSGKGRPQPKPQPPIGSPATSQVTTAQSQSRKSKALSKVVRNQPKETKVVKDLKGGQSKPRHKTKAQRT